VITYEQIYKSYLNCRKNKRNTGNQLAFEADAESNLLRLQEELNDRSYRPGRSICFVVAKPKLREVFAADFRDRVVHHVLIEQLTKICEPRFIHDSFACRVERGTHKAKERLQEFGRSITRNGTRNAYFMQLDVKSFFVMIDKMVLKAILRKHTDDEYLLWLADLIIDNDCTQDCLVTRGGALLDKIPAHKSLFKVDRSKGLPIGNLSSQFFANLYLNELDQFIKRELKARYYLRYMDDFVIMNESREQLCEWMEAVELFLAEMLNLELHPTKRVINTVSSGIDFVGYIVRPNYALVRNRVIGNLKEKLARGDADPRTLDSYAGHFKHAQCGRLVTAINRQLINAGSDLAITISR
jgi:RNA-directed DNA polymerase